MTDSSSSLESLRASHYFRFETGGFKYRNNKIELKGLKILIETRS